MASAAAAATLLFAAGADGPSLILDQSFDPMDVSPTAFNGNTYAQTFTVGLPGLLVEVKVGLDPGFNPTVPFEPYDLEFQIRETNASGVPTSNVLASKTVTVHSSDTWATLDLWGDDLSVRVGDVLAIYQPGKDPPRGAWNTYVGAIGTGYPDGSAFQNNVRLGSQNLEVDFAFETYVIPSPGSFALMVMGLAGLAAMVRTRRI